MSQQNKNYDVHIFALVRVKVKDVPALSHHEAIEEAVKRVDLSTFTSRGLIGGMETEDAEEISHYLVDEVGDTERQGSTWYKDASHWTEIAADPLTSADLHPEQPSKLVDKPAPGTPLAVLMEFAADCEAVGLSHVKDEWPDLWLTYLHATSAIAAAMAPETDEATKFVEMVAGFTKDGECPECHEDGNADSLMCEPPEHDPFEMSIDDSYDTIAGLIDKARAIQARWKGVPA